MSSEILNSKARQLLLIDGYKFGFLRSLPGNKEYWLCTSRKTSCKAYVQTEGAEETITEFRLDHNHYVSDPRQIPSDDAKPAAAEDTCEQPVKINRNEITNDDCDTLTAKRKGYVQTEGAEETITEFRLDHDPRQIPSDDAKRAAAEDTCEQPVKKNRNEITSNDCGTLTAKRKKVRRARSRRLRKPLKTRREFHDLVENQQIKKEPSTDMVLEPSSDIVKEPSTDIDKEPSTDIVLEPSSKMLEACRTCLRVIDLNKSPFYEIEADNVQLWTESCRFKLLTLIPEMRLNITPKPIICAGCYFSLRSMFEFKAQCLKTENIIMQYLCAKPDVDIKNLNLKDVSDFNMSHSGDTNASGGKLVKVFIKDIKGTGKKKNTDETGEIKNTEDEVVAGQEEVEFSDIDLTIVKHEVDDFSSENVEVVPPKDTVLEPRTDVRWYNDKISSSKHVEVHSEVKEYKNHSLGFIRFKQNKLRWAGKSYRCKTCNERFEQLSQLKIHRSKHKTTITIQRRRRSKTREHKFVCTICGFFYCYESSLKRHMRSHTDHREVDKDVDVKDTSLIVNNTT